MTNPTVTTSRQSEAAQAAAAGGGGAAVPPPSPTSHAAMLAAIQHGASGQAISPDVLRDLQIKEVTQSLFPSEAGLHFLKREVDQFTKWAENAYELETVKQSRPGRVCIPEVLEKLAPLQGHLEIILSNLQTRQTFYDHCPSLSKEGPPLDLTLQKQRCSDTITRVEALQMALAKAKEALSNELAGRKAVPVADGAGSAGAAKPKKERKPPYQFETEKLKGAISSGKSPKIIQKNINELVEIFKNETGASLQGDPSKQVLSDRAFRAVEILTELLKNPVEYCRKYPQSLEGDDPKEIQAFCTGPGRPLRGHLVPNESTPGTLKQLPRAIHEWRAACFPPSSPLLAAAAAGSPLARRPSGGDLPHMLSDQSDQFETSFDMDVDAEYLDHLQFTEEKVRPYQEFLNKSEPFQSIRQIPPANILTKRIVHADIDLLLDVEKEKGLTLFINQEIIGSGTEIISHERSTQFARQIHEELRARLQSISLPPEFSIDSSKIQKAINEYFLEYLPEKVTKNLSKTCKGIGLISSDKDQDAISLSKYITRSVLLDILPSQFHKANEFETETDDWLISDKPQFMRPKFPRSVGFPMVQHQVHEKVGHAHELQVGHSRHKTIMQVLTGTRSKTETAEPHETAYDIFLGKRGQKSPKELDFQQFKENLRDFVKDDNVIVFEGTMPRSYFDPDLSLTQQLKEDTEQFARKGRPEAAAGSSADSRPDHKVWHFYHAKSKLWLCVDPTSRTFVNGPWGFNDEAAWDLLTTGNMKGL